MENRKLIDAKVLDVLRFTAETRGAQRARDIVKLSTSALLRDEEVVRRSLQRLTRAGAVTREVRRRYVGVSNHAFRSGASVVRREAFYTSK